MEVAGTSLVITNQFSKMNAKESSTHGELQTQDLKVKVKARAKAKAKAREREENSDSTWPRLMTTTATEL